MHIFLKYNWSKLSWVVAIETGVIVIISTFFLPGGEDIHRYYLPFANGCLNCGFVPYYAQWFLWPFSLISPRFVWPFLTAVSVAGFISLSWFTNVNPAILILSFPAMGQLWLGQIDVFVSAGLAIALLAENPYLCGVGILLALVKPQLTGLAVLVLLIRRPRQETAKILAPLFVAITISFFVYGFSWPLDWISNAASNLPVHVWRLASKDFWIFGIMLIPTIFLFKSRRSQFEAALTLSALATPFFGVYSHVIFLVFRAPWWSLPLSYLWFLAYPVLGKSSLRFSWVLPLGVLGYLWFNKNMFRKSTEGKKIST